ncbi:hypothetical protein GCM10010433_19250 [Streptomyces pulveraceus]
MLAAFAVDVVHPQVVFDVFLAQELGFHGHDETFPGTEDLVLPGEVGLSVLGELGVRTAATIAVRAAFPPDSGLPVP